MEFAATTMHLYLDHAFAGMGRVLDRVDDDTVNLRPAPWGTNSIAGLIVHCCELTPSWFEMPGLGRDSVRDRDTEFTAKASVQELRDRIAATLTRSHALIDEFVAGPTATEHEFRGFLPGGDRSDGALVVHVFEELYQHLGHMEVTADALVGAPG